MRLQRKHALVLTILCAFAGLGLMAAAGLPAVDDSARVHFILEGVDTYCRSVKDCTTKGTFSRWSKAGNGFESTEKVAFSFQSVGQGLRARSEVLANSMFEAEKSPLHLYTQDMSWVDGELRIHHVPLGNATRDQQDRSQLDYRVVGPFNPLYYATTLAGKSVLDYIASLESRGRTVSASVVEEQEGLSVVEIRSRKGERESRYRLFVDRTKGFAITRMQAWDLGAGQDPTCIIENELKQTTAGIWVPSKATYQKYVVKDGVYQLMMKYDLEYTETAVNTGLKKEDLPIQFPSGTTVLDTPHDGQYTIMSEKELNAIATAAVNEMAKANAPLETAPTANQPPASSEPASAAPTAPARNGSFMVAAVFALVFLCIAAWLFGRKFARRERNNP